MVAGIKTRLWEMSDIVKMMEDAETDRKDSAYGEGDT
jgi:hypothetical protein